MKMGVLFGAMMVWASAVWAGQSIEYKGGGATMEGYLAMPETKQRIHPAVLIVHDWMGIDGFKAKADEMAKLGYVAFAADIYGKGVHPKDAKEAGALAGKYKADVKTLRERVKAAFETLLKQPGVDKKHVVAFGYCFGGTTVLELARSGADLQGVASFHGGLATPNPKDAKNIKAKLLIMHGAIDPYVPAKEVEGFLTEMNDAKVDYQFITYSGAVHAFTIKAAGNDPKAGAVYNEVADRRSWQAFTNFLSETAPL